MPPRPVAPPARRRAVGAVDLTPRPGALPPHPGWALLPAARDPGRDDHPPPSRPDPAPRAHRRRRRLRRTRPRTDRRCGDRQLAHRRPSADACRPHGTPHTRAPPGTASPWTRSSRRTLKGDGAGPGGADRLWTRIAVAPDSGCAAALDPLLLKSLAPVGCEPLLRATYTDATASNVTTVGLIFTAADAAAMSALSTRFTDGRAGRAHRSDAPYRTPAKGTVAARFGDRQRASWTVSRADRHARRRLRGLRLRRRPHGRRPAARRRGHGAGATSAPAQAGLGNEAQGIADRIERGLRRPSARPPEKPE